MFAAEADKALQLLLRVGGVGVVHSRAAVAQAPLRLKNSTAGQAYESLGYIQQLRPQHQVIVEIARFGAVAAIRQMVVVQLVAEIEPAAAQVVIEQAEADAVALRQGKGNMLIERIGAGGVIAHRVEVAHFEATAAAV